jgi:microcystin-dependent protein
MKNANIILYSGIGLVILVLIVVTVFLIRKEKEGYSVMPSSQGGLMLESDANGNLSTSATLPIGAIIMWCNNANTVPKGWQICDGTNGTPDLRGKFAIGTASDTDPFPPNSTGGSASVMIQPDNLPAHRHALPMYPGNNLSNANSITNVVNENTSLFVDGNGSPNGRAFVSNTPSYNTNSSINGTWGYTTFSGSGSQTPISTLPPYLSVYYIMKMA